jgi:ketosteroid isomerase-like protein
MPRPIDVLREGHRAFNDDDLEALLATAHADVEWRTTGQFAGLGPLYRGHDGVAQWVTELKEAWKTFDAGIAEVVFDRDDRCGVVEELKGRGRASGVEVTLQIFALYQVADGKLVRREIYADRAALEAAEEEG